MAKDVIEAGKITEPITADESSSAFSAVGRIHCTDQQLDTDLSQSTLQNRLFLRLVAKGRTLKGVDFRYSIFDTCYVRDCIFDSCNFTGCRFAGSNFHGSKFSGCKFEYSIFERTHIDSDLLDTECPGHENLKMRFARSLRMNYQQVGDARAVNKAIAVELQATRVHLSKAWSSNESYYRQKYRGLIRLKVFVEWISFIILDWVWGNGESIVKLIRTTAILFAVMAIFDVFVSKSPYALTAYGSSLAAAPEIFLGVVSPKIYPAWYLTVILFIRLIAFGFFMSIAIKRFNRR